nr:PREDICTED: inactive tyrosine-protein kinase 7-like [Notothenia coriiceps]
MAVSKPREPERLTFRDVQSPQEFRHGETAEVVCDVISSPVPVVVWYYQDKEITEEHHSRFQVLPNNNLQIHQVTKADEGVYRCEASVEARGEIDFVDIAMVVNEELQSQPQSDKLEKKAPEKLPKPVMEKPAKPALETPPKTAAKPASPDSFTTKQGGERTSKSPPPPPPPRKTFSPSSSSGMTTTRSGEVVYTSRRDSVSAQVAHLCVS